MQDNTERKAAQKQLREADEKYRSIFENASEGIFQNTPEGVLLSANPALARMLGFASPEELIRERNNVEQQGYPEPARREEFKRLLEEKGVVDNFEYEVKRKDGMYDLGFGKRSHCPRCCGQRSLLRRKRAGHHRTQTGRAQAGGASGPPQPRPGCHHGARYG